MNKDIWIMLKGLGAPPYGVGSSFRVFFFPRQRMSRVESDSQGILAYRNVILVLSMFFIFSSSVLAKIDFTLTPINDPVVYDNVIEAKTGNPNIASSTGDISEKKSYSKAKAVLLTMLVPGAGHFYLGQKGRGEVFMGTEVVAWAGFFAFRIYGNWREDDYIRYAQEHAGIDPDGKDDDFYGRLSFYNSRDDYNTAGRLYNPGDPYYPDISTYYWYWDSDDSREKYRDIRNGSQSSYRKATFMIGVAIVNRIIAGIDVFRLAGKMKSRSSSEYSNAGKTKLKINTNLFSRDPGLSLTLSHRF